MLVRLLAAACVAAACVFASFGMSVERASACSVGELYSGSLPHLLDESSVVVVGRLRNATRAEITLEVEEGLKGARSGERLTLSNHHFGLGAACEVYVEGAGGFALPEEARVIAFLQPDLSGKAGVLMPSLFGHGVFVLASDETPFGGWDGQPGRIDTIGDFREALKKEETTSFDPSIEKVPPCNYIALVPENANVIARLTQAVAVARVRSIEGLSVTFDTEEVLRGDPGRTFTLNGQHFHQANSCDLTPEGHVAYVVGQRLLLFLYPDEFGVAEFRAGDWGGGVLPLNGQWVSDLPTLDNVRDLLASGIGTAPPPSNAPRIRDGVLVPAFWDVLEETTPAPTEQPHARTELGSEDAREDRWWFALVGLAILAGASVVAVGAWRKYRR